MSKSLVIEYYTDLLCVWAWIAQRRIDELENEFGKQVEIRFHYVDIFGDVPGKIEKNWRDRGAYDGFAAHVHQSVKRFEDAPVNEKVWKETRPATSANAHLFLKAIELNYGKQKSEELALVFRKAFFIEGRDIGEQSVLWALVGEAQLDLGSSIEDGSAMAALMSDYQRAREKGIKGSPSFVMDQGRQTLYGNVGYRVLRANIEELLNNPAGEASWC